ncbi:MAG TPA: GtrA family protein [Bryobacteraceae bacterium]|nr:GtrA family protein [Bryobacteraceae bacterium]
MMSRALSLRWLKFNLVGAIGFVVQLVALRILHGGLGMNYLVATALAVEIAVLHNFVWHELYTWRDRTRQTPGGTLGRLAGFNLTNGVLSIAGNLGIMRVLVGRFGMNYLAANVLSILACSLANFAASHWLVFRGRERG